MKAKTCVWLKAPFAPVKLQAGKTVLKKCSVSSKVALEHLVDAYSTHCDLSPHPPEHMLVLVSTQAQQMDNAFVSGYVPTGPWHGAPGPLHGEKPAFAGFKASHLRNNKPSQATQKCLIPKGQA